MSVIKSPSSGDSAEVDSSFKLLTRAVTETSNTEAILAGQGFNVESGEVTLTTANSSAVLFFKNDDDNDLVFIASRSTAGPTTAGTETFIKSVFTFGPSAMASGTGTDATPGNLRLGSSLSVEFTSEIGQEGATLTGGVASPAVFQTIETTDDREFFFVLPKGQSFGVSVEPPAANTSIIVNTSLNFYVNEAR